MGEPAGGRGHAVQQAGSRVQLRNSREEPLSVQIGIAHQAGCAATLHGLRIARLMIVGGEWERHQDAGTASRGQFGNRAGAGAGDHQIGLRKGRGHIGDERHNFAFQAAFGKGALQIGEAGGSALMHDADAVRGGAEERPTFAGGAVERSRALAAPGDQNVQGAAGRPRRRAEEFFADREAGGFGPPGGKMGCRFRERDERARDEAADDAVGETASSEDRPRSRPC